MQFVIGNAAIHELSARDVQTLNAALSTGKDIDAKTLKAIQGKLFVKLGRIQGFEDLVNGLEKGSPNVALNAIRTFVTQYRSEARVKAAA